MIHGLAALALLAQAYGGWAAIPLPVECRPPVPSLWCCWAVAEPATADTFQMSPPWRVVFCADWSPARDPLSYSTTPTIPPNGTGY